MSDLRQPMEKIPLIFLHACLSWRGRHNEVDDYHEWITFGERVKADRRGRKCDRLIFPTPWTKWICNNGSCSAEVWVHDDLVRHFIQAELTQTDLFLRGEADWR